MNKASTKSNVTSEEQELRASKKDEFRSQLVLQFSLDLLDVFVRGFHNHRLSPGLRSSTQMLAYKMHYRCLEHAFAGFALASLLLFLFVLRLLKM
ncbi:hypothetical protein L596_017101 [Steinernema carpocapsae]|uniref:Uncharacterized protein n=1 Tax=Steinernema carpocapsae TaxID=34508 RepID=A0A4U5N0I0_STECR|nr:hypothetical protein L596_017101 [Steinernema carpocapsae]